MATANDFRAILEGHDTALLDSEFPFYPLDSPGMPLPGDAFIAAATGLGDSPPAVQGRGQTQWVSEYGRGLHYLYRRALYDESFALPVSVGRLMVTAAMLTGHLLGDSPEGLRGGPRLADVMIIGKNPGREEMRSRENFVGPTSEIFFNALADLGVGHNEWAAWYGTNLVKWPSLDMQSDTLPAAHKKDNHVLLAQELRLVRPKYILCLGSDASKWLLGVDHGVQSMVGRVEELVVPLHLRDQTPQLHRAKVMAVTHPAQVFRRPELYDEFKNQIALFLSLTNGTEIGGAELGLNHRNLYTARHLSSVIAQIKADPDPLRRIIAVDAEWHGDYPTEPGAYLRTVQFSSAHGEGYTVVLRHQGGSPAFQPSISHAITLLNSLLKTDLSANWKPRLGGHFFRADLPWLYHNGIDIRAEYAAPDHHLKMRDEGGWDTSLAYHAVNEAASYRLTDVMVRLTNAPVYDGPIKDAVTEFCKTNDIDKEDLEGYGFLPDWVLHSNHVYPGYVPHSYSAYDADCTRRIIMRLLKPGGLLDSDWFGNSSWEPYWISQRAALGVLQMEMTGIELDNKRVDELSLLYAFVYDALLTNFRHKINWPTFNPSSQPQVTGLLFGDQFGRKKDKATGGTIPVRPEGSVTLNLTPIKTTGKRSKIWADVVGRRETAIYKPSTDRESLGILGHAHPLAMQLRDLKFVGQSLRGAIRRPTMEDDDYVRDEDDNLVYEKGIPSWVHADGRIRTHIQQTKETRRYSSSRPPLQNISSRREDDYGRIAGRYRDGKPLGDYLDVFPQPLYSHPIRSIFKAAEGCILIEADLSGAELAVMAWLSGDPAMIDHIRRGTLPKDHPDYYEIHSRTAVRVFKLDCEPTKKGLKSIGKEPLRTAAKAVNFSIPYGQQADALSRKCREEHVDISADQCQFIIDDYFRTYPRTEDFLRECRDRSQNARWIAGAYGGMRRFIGSRERSTIADQERQAQNFPIQNTVADNVQIAIYNFWSFQQAHPEYLFKMLLQNHDALLFEVPIPEAAVFVKEILPRCMIQEAPVWPRYLDNRPMAVSQPYHFTIEKKFCLNWGEELDEKQLAALGLPSDLLDD